MKIDVAALEAVAAEPGVEGVEGNEAAVEAVQTPLPQDVLADAREEAFVAALSEGGEPSAADLREFFGDDAAGLSDEALLQEWQAQRAAAQQGSEPSQSGPADPAAAGAPPAASAAAAAAAATVKHAFELLNGEGKPLTPEQLETIKQLQVKYKAADAETVEALGELVRKAQRTPFVDRRIGDVLRSRNELAEENVGLRGEVEELRTQQRVWQRALSDPSGEKLRELQESYLQALRAEPEGPAAQSGAAPSLTPEQATQQGTLIYLQQIKPRLDQMAAEYAPSENEAAALGARLESTFQQLVAQEGAMFQARGAEYSRRRVEEILTSDLPFALEQGGYARQQRSAAPSGGAAAPAGEPAVEALRAENRALRARLAAQRVASAPGSGGSGGGNPPASLNRANPALEKAGSWDEIKQLLDAGTLELGV